MKIVYKMLFMFVVPLFFIVAFQIYNLEGVNSQINEVRDEFLISTAEESGHIANIRFLSTSISNSLNQAVIALDIDDVETKDKEILLVKNYTELRLKELEIIRKSIFNLENTNNQNPSSILLKRLENDINESDSLTDGILNKIEQGEKKDDLTSVEEEVLGQLLEVNNAIFQSSSELLLNKQNEIKESKLLMISIQKQGVQRLYVVSLLSFFIILFMLIIFNFMVIKGITRVTESIDKISQGDFKEIIVEKNRDDEIGKLARAFDRVLVSLKLAMAQRSPELKKKGDQKELEESTKVKTFKKTVYSDKD